MERKTENNHNHLSKQHSGDAATEEQAWRKHVEEVIARLERRAAGGEVYAALCLQGWRQELQRIKERRHE